MEQPLDFQESTIPTAGPRHRSAKSASWRVSIFVVTLTWLTVGFLAVTLHPETVTGLVARGLGPIVALGDASISPGDPCNEPGSLVCNDVSRTNASRLTGGTSLMKRTNEGRNLYNELLANDVCLTVRDLGYFAGFAIPRRSLDGGWTLSTIEIDREHLESVGSDVLAATLVHEAAHLDRAFHGTSCLTGDDCSTLENGVFLEEEVAAHAAEARWWIAIYGRDGKSDPDPVENWQNHLAFAYLAGAEPFEDFVESFRSDPEEASR
jgi:hypothetical protein